MARFGLAAVLSSAALLLAHTAAAQQKPKPKPKTENAPKGEAPSAPSPPGPADGGPQQPPPPAGDSGTSTVGVELLPPSGATATSPTVPPTTAASGGYDAAKGGELEQRVRALEGRLDAAERANAESDAKLRWLKRLTISGYVQPQLLLQWYNAAASPNAGPTGLPSGITSNDTIAQPNPINPGGPGITTNGDYFRLRRARLQLEFMPTDFARLVLEIEPFPLGGPTAKGGLTSGVGTLARTVEAQGIVHWTQDVVTEFAAGSFRIPFSFEILQLDADRPFIERSWGEANMFPGEYDTGARAYTRALGSRLGVQLALVNGAMLGEPTYSLWPDLNKGKDAIGRVNYDFGPVDVALAGYYGQGQIVDPVGIRFKQFPRWAASLQAGLHHTFVKRLGQTRLFGELTLAQDMDRGVNYGIGVGLPAFPADVVNGGAVDHDERSTWLRLEQDLTEWFTLGLRYDFYTPDAAQQNDGRDTYGAVAVVHFTRGLQWMLEVDHAIDNVHAPGSQAPSRQIETLSNVLQARF